MSNPNLKDNWVTLGITLGFILALLCWPVTLILLVMWLMFKFFGIFHL